ncbi:MAG: TonB-dependent receptor [Ferruginibacter sp.]
MKVKILLSWLLLCIAYMNTQAQQPITITGSVKTANGQPLAGATVTQTSTTNTTVTDADGMFKLNVTSQKNTVEVSYIGYTKVAVSLKNKTNLDVILQDVNATLDDVVVVGYGTQKKVNLTGAVSSVSAKTLDKISVPNAGNILQGRMTGLEVIQPTGKPGNDNPLIRVRGMGSFGASSAPLVLIDGVLGSLSNIAPSDIESVTVLKDAASASIYGARAANGVILLTTKRAKLGAASLEYKLDIGIQNATRTLDLIWNSAEYMTMYNAARLRSGKSEVYTQAQIDAYANATDRVQYPNFNWPEYIFQTATIYNHSLSFAKATETSKFRFSLNYSDQGGILPVYAAKRYTANLNYENQVLKRVKIGTIINFNHISAIEPQGGSAIDQMRGIYNRTPLAMPFLPDGRKSSGRAYDTEAFSVWAPIAYTNGDNRNNTYSAKAQAYVIVDILKGLQWETKGAIGFDNYFSKLHTFSTPGEFYYYQKLPGATDYAVDQSVGTPGTLGVYDNNTTSITPTLYSTLKYNTKIRDHEINAMVGYEQQSNNFRSLSGSRITFPTAELAELNAGSPTGQNLGGTSTGWGLQSLFGRIAYDFRGKYLLETNLRYDGTSRVQEDNRWGVFPSLSAGWRISEEKFLKDKLGWLNNLKFRGSYGLLGNQEIGLYPYQDIFSNANYSYGSSVSQGVAVTRLTDKNLHWEKTKILDFGVDVDVFKGLFGLVFDWYKKDAYDILATLPVPASLGLSGPTTNDGAVRNTGMELALTHSNNIGQLHYDVNFQISSNKNKVVSILTPTKGAIEVGLPYNSYYIYEWIGIFQDQAEIDKSAKQNNNPKPGDLKMKDQNGDGIIDANDRKSFTRFPKYNYSVSVNFAWKGFSLAVFLQAVEGSTAFLNAGNWTSFPFREGIPPSVEYRNAWTPENHSNTVPAVHDFSYAGVYGYTSSFLLKNSSYLRLKNTYLSYTLPQSILKTIKAKELSVYVSGSNLLTFTKFKDGDPEGPEGADLNQFPQLRSFNFGLNVKF